MVRLMDCVPFFLVIPAIFKRGRKQSLGIHVTVHANENSKREARVQVPSRMTFGEICSHLFL